jgi:hypothetical protein
LRLEGLGKLNMSNDLVGNRTIAERMKVILQLVYVAFEVLTAVVMKCTIVCDLTPCSPFKVNSDVSEEHIASIFRVVNVNKCETLDSIAIF